MLKQAQIAGSVRIAALYKTKAFKIIDSPQETRRHPVER
jgi:hypothetical protein